MRKHLGRSRVIEERFILAYSLRQFIHRDEEDSAVTVACGCDSGRVMSLVTSHQQEGSRGTQVGMRYSHEGLPSSHLLLPVKLHFPKHPQSTKNRVTNRDQVFKHTSLYFISKPYPEPPRLWCFVIVPSVCFLFL